MEAMLFTVYHFLKDYDADIEADLYLDTESSSTVVDPLAVLEKTTDAQNNLKNVQIPRLESLQTVSEHYNLDPYSLSTKVRKRFREEKKVEQRKKRADDHIKGRYGLPESLSLVEDDEASRQEAKQEWDRAKRDFALQESSKRRRLDVDIVTIPSSTSSRSSQLKTSTSNPLGSLRARILENSARQSNPFNKQRAATNTVSRK